MKYNVTISLVREKFIYIGKTMTKQILSATVIAALTFVGCSQVSKTADAVKSTTKTTTEKVTKKATDTVDSSKNVSTGKVNTTVSKVDTKLSSMKVDAPESSLKVGDVVESKIDDASASSDATLPTSSSMTDMATNKVIEVADTKTDGAATKVIDAIK